MTPDDIKQRALEAAAMAAQEHVDAHGMGYDPVDGLVEDAIAAYEAALWSTDMDAAPRDGTSVDLLIKWEHKEPKREPDAQWSQNSDGLYDWYLTHEEEFLDEFVGYEVLAWRPLPTLPENI